MNRADILSEVRALVPPVNAGQPARAWALSWRVVRFLERAVETARRARVDSLDPHATVADGDSVKFLAARCVQIAVPKPVLGEAAVAAALENAVDVARGVAAKLYADYIERHEKASEAVLRDPRRLAALRRARSVAIVRVEPFIGSTRVEE
jgi:hypothetical protein